MNRYKEFLNEYENKRDYFQCHEILEELWKEETNCDTKEHPAVILLQIAVGAYHWENKNITGATKVLQGVLAHYGEVEVALEEIGFDSKKLKEVVENEIDSIKENKEFKHFSLPIKN
ncbi:Predicted metal-dependent hydrolase [Cetobacterium ceti]|uniref:Predicted metal-dependent hydrolase n=1 Tax=Cetobacterium ceti TaxID=180163 RepID=A0A1T4MZA2_9FUSO|nr:DUF309 domain-containing protein [Cetobacterium ceti]SJZ71968.1 Predicted metal-dependent hydrolase [Cetobacterium ceti]